jgi:hypothetical protein
VKALQIGNWAGDAAGHFCDLASIDGGNSTTSAFSTSTTVHNSHRYHRRFIQVVGAQRQSSCQAVVDGPVDRVRIVTFSAKTSHVTISVQLIACNLCYSFMRATVARLTGIYHQESSNKSIAIAGPWSIHVPLMREVEIHF